VSTVGLPRSDTGQHHYLAGVATLLAGLLFLAGSVFGITAGVAAIWSDVAGSGSSATPAAAGPAAGELHTLHLVVKEIPNGHGQLDQAFVPGNFTMEVGETLRVTVTNYTSMPHTWTSAGLGVNVMVPAGGSSSPSTTTFVIHAAKPGTYFWHCETPCDPWSMSHMGFMEGNVTVVRD
jgi:hypothetical protein